MFIKLELEVTPKQMTAIGQVLSGQQPETTQAPEVEVVSVPKPVTSVVVTDTPQAGPPALNTTTQTVTDTPAQAATAQDIQTSAGGEAPVSPAATAFAADVETAESNFIGVELGKGTNGQQIPWDARIHGKAKKKNADDSWRLMQGVDRDVLVPQVEAELVEALASVPKPVTDAAEPSQEQTAVTPPPPAAPTNTAGDAVPPAEVPPAPAADTTKPTTFAELLPLVTTAKAAGTLTDETIANCCSELGLASFGLIATRPDLIPQAAELLGV